MNAEEKRTRDAAASRRYRARNLEKVRAGTRASNERQKEKRKAAHQGWLQKHKYPPEHKAKANAAARKSYAKRTAREDLETAGRPKPEVCDVCEQPGRICFDHCHTEVRFRGYLCFHCILALGHVRDNPDTLRRLAVYLEK